MPQGPLAPLPSGKLKLGAEHFRKVVRRIEDIKPLAGEGIKITPKEGGIEISAVVTQGAGGGGGNNNLPLRPIEITVCYDGQPAVIRVYSPDGEFIVPEIQP